MMNGKRMTKVIWNEKQMIRVFFGIILAAFLFCILPPHRVLAAGIKQVSLGGNYSAALKADGSLWMWGDNEFGQLGNGTTKNSSKPIKIMDGVQQVSLGNNHTAALKTDGSLWTWGYNGFGRLGNGTTKNSSKPIKIMDGVKQVSLGGDHSAALKTDGSLWMWGFNYYDQFGNGTMKDSNKPIKIMDGVKQVSLGDNHSAAIKTDGSLWIWGYNGSGQCGVTFYMETCSPRKIMDRVQQVSLGDSFSAALKTDGSLWMWGNNWVGQLGKGNTEGGNYAPEKIMDGIQQVSLGWSHSAALKKDKSLWMWGYNETGQLGNKTNKNNSKPVKILTGVSQVSLGGMHSAALKSDGSLWMWGSNEYGQLGNGNTVSSNVPIKITLPDSGEKKTDIAKCSISLSKNQYTYTGKAVKAAVTIKNGSAALKQGTDFTVKYSNNVNLGSSAAVIITGKGKYTGTVKKTFQIVLAVPKLVSAQAEASNSVKVTWNKVTGAKTYKLYYKEAGAANWTGVKTNIAGTTYTHTSNKLQAGKQYIYTVRAVNGEHTSGFDKNGVSVIIPASTIRLKMTGVVTNSATGKGLTGVTLNFRRGLNNKTGSTYVKASSGANGNYNVELEEGQYTVQLSKTGYVTTYTNIECKKASSGAAARVDLSISARLATGQYRIVLSWGATPEDLDAHLTGPLSNGKRFHIFYREPVAVNNGKQAAKVDVDDKTSYGPETVTINLDAGASGVYRYYVHDYSNKHLSSSSGLANSGARITVYKGDKQIATYSVPEQAGTKWHVFNINNGKLVKVNKMSYEQSPGNFN